MDNGHEIKLTEIIDRKSRIALTRMKRRYPSFNKFKNRMLSKNILVGLDDTYYLIEGTVNPDNIEKVLNLHQSKLL